MRPGNGSIRQRYSTTVCSTVERDFGTCLVYALTNAPLRQSSVFSDEAELS
jgi:hypothetical protein